MSALVRFVSASGFANLADGVAVVAWAWLASLMTRDPLWLALMPVALRLPWFLMALPAGIVTDRVDRKTLILAMDILRAGAFAIAAIALVITPLPAATTQGVSAPGLFVLLLCLATIIGVAEVFRDNAAQTMLPSLVDHKDLERANGRLWSVELIGNFLIGPALGAFLIATALALPFILNAAAFALAACLVASVSGRFKPPPKERNWRKELGEGLSFLKTAPLLRLLAVVTGLWNLFDQMVVVGLVLHVQENLGLDAKAYGLMLSASAFGGIAGGLVAERVVAAIGPFRAAQFTTAGSAVAFLGMAFAPNAYVLALILAAFEFNGLIWNTVSVSYRQRVIPDALLGRVNSVYRMLAWGMMPLGLILSGVLVRLAETVTPRETALLAPFVVAGIGVVILAIVAWRPLGRGFSRSAGG